MKIKFPNLFQLHLRQGIQRNRNQDLISL